jgi:hypothetical protein
MRPEGSTLGVKRMDFFAGQGARRRHSMAYGNDEQRSHAEKGAVSCFDISEPQD